MNCGVRDALKLLREASEQSSVVLQGLRWTANASLIPLGRTLTWHALAKMAFGEQLRG